MSERLERLLHDLERFQEINKSDIPELVKLVKELSTENDRAWERIEELERQMGAFR
jgi:hypothetical protein